MKREAEVTERAALYQEMIVQAVELRTSAPQPMPDLDMLLLTMVDRLEALLWVLDELDDDILDREGPLH